MNLPAEWQEWKDEQTGRRVIEFTSQPCINHPLYYLTNTFSPDSRSLIFASNRAGKTDLYRVSLDSGEIDRLTDVEGLLPFSGNVVGNEVFYSTSKGEIRVLDLLSLEDRTIHACPGAVLGEVTVSCDGQWIACLANEEGVAGLLIVAKEGSHATRILSGVRALYHPQFHPTLPDQLIYSADPPDPRMWAVRRDGSEDRCLYRHSPDQWWVHETFLGRSGRMIVNHWKTGILEVGWEGKPPRTVVELSSWHIASNRAGTRIVCDTHLPDIGLCLVDPETGKWEVLCLSKATSKGTQWSQDRPLSADAMNAPGYATMVEETSGETAYGPQWTHPHPSFSPDGKWVAFTSDVSGWPQAYVVAV